MVPISWTREMMHAKQQKVNTEVVMAQWNEAGNVGYTN